MSAIPPIYISHAGTLKISRITDPRKAGRCAYEYLKQGQREIDFFAIGASANQQAMKSIGIFMLMVNDADLGLSVAFQPHRYSVRAKDLRSDKEEFVVIDAVVWKTILIEDTLKGVQIPIVSKVSI